MSRSGSLLKEALRSMAGIMGPESNLDRPPAELTRCSRTAGAAFSSESGPDASGALGDLVLWPDATDW
jgi:hypothetical protein